MSVNDLTGATVTYGVYNPAFGTSYSSSYFGNPPATFTVGNGTEYDTPLYSFDFTAAGLVITFNDFGIDFSDTGRTYVGPVFTFQDAPAITNVTVHEFFQFDSSDYSFDATHLYVNLLDLSIGVTPLQFFFTFDAPPPPQNSAPAAQAASANGNENSPITGQLSASDSDGPNALTYSRVAQPQHGMVTVNGDGSFTYTPNAGYHGGDSFTFKANDGIDDSNVATVSLTITATNHAPVAQGGSASGDESTPITGQLSASDSDGPNALTYSRVAQPQHGMVTVNGNGSFTYTPNAGYHGDDSFTFKANDGAGDSNVATVNLTVREIDPLVVTKTVDDGSIGTLRYAIDYANSHAGADTITFGAGLAGTITLTQGQLVLSSDITIDGDNAGNDNKADITISGNDASRVFDVTSGTAVLRSLTITDGASWLQHEPGGAIRNAGDLTLEYSTVRDSSSVDFGQDNINHGGAIYSNGALTIESSTLSGNAGYLGTAIYAAGGTFDMSNSTITGSSTIASFAVVLNGQVTIRNSTITSSLGGFSLQSGAATIENSIIDSQSGISGSSITLVGGNIIGPNQALNVYSGETPVGTTTPAALYAQTVNLSNGIIGGVLADNGGPVWTVALNTAATNPALDASGSGATATDARGVVAYDNPNVTNLQGSARDLGAFELSPTPHLSIDDVSKSEGGLGTTTFTFTVSLDAPAGADGVTFDISTANGTATAAGGDYVARSLTGQTIAVGHSSYTFDVTVNGDGTAETNETFFVNVTNVTGAAVADAQGLATINNPEAPSLVVTTTADVVADDGLTSLREAIAFANSGDADGVGGAADTITFASGLTGTIRLTGGTLSVTEALTIHGSLDENGKPKITISGDASSNDTLVAGSTVITDIAASQTAATLADNVQIINTTQDIRLDSLVLTGGVADGDDIATGRGGAINAFNDAPQVSITATNMTFAGNSAASSGGALHASGTVELENSTVSGNVSGSAVSGAGGGGIFASTVDLTNTTVSGNNAAGRGGGIFGIAVMLKNATVSGNFATADAGGVNGNNGTLFTMRNSIIAGNDAAGNDDVSTPGPNTRVDGNIIGTTVFDGNTVVGSTTLANVFASVTANPHTGVLSGTLADNGGPVQTIALKTSITNPAIDAAGASAPAMDARGVARADNPNIANVNGTGADLGAFELPSFAQPVLSIGPIAGDNVVNAAEGAGAITISGIATGVEDGQFVTLALKTADGSVTLQTITTAVSGGAWHLDLPPGATPAFPDGTYLVTADVSDHAGNPATQVSETIRVDVTAPTLTMNPIAGDNVVDAAEGTAVITISGTAAGAEDGQLVTLALKTADGSVTLQTITAAVSGGAWHLDLPPGATPAFPDGTYLVTAEVSDQAGNPAAGVSETIRIDVAAPKLDHMLADQSFAVNHAFDFTVPADSFSDQNGDPLTYAATRANGDPLPSWVHFDAGTLHFFGTPATNFVGDLDIKVVASDGALTASDHFLLSFGNDGNDLFVSGTGTGSTDNDPGIFPLAGGQGDDTYLIEDDLAQVFENAGAGADTVYTTVSYTMPQNVEGLVLQESGGEIGGTGTDSADTIIGNSFANTLIGGGGSDALIGGGGDDVLIGGGGDDGMAGGTGNDTYNVDSAGDQVLENFAAGQDTVYASVSYGLTDDVEGLVLTEAGGAINGTGNASDNYIFGNSAANSIDGGAGNDVLFGGGGADILVGGAGDDVLVGGEGDDLFAFAPGQFGHDKVTDFTSGDRIVFDHTLFADFADLQAHAVQSGAHTVIEHDPGNTLTLSDVEMANLAANDFMFV